MSDALAHRCTFTRPDGSGCGANALRGSDPPLCFFHNPKAERARREARRSGGRSRSRPAATLSANEPDAPLATISDVTNYLGRIVNCTAKGTVDVKIANAISSLSNVLARCIAQSDVEQRLLRMEERLAAMTTVKGEKR